jgi:hypothetical protein
VSCDLLYPKWNLINKDLLNFASSFYPLCLKLYSCMVAEHLLVYPMNCRPLDPPLNGSSARITRTTHSMQSMHNLCLITGTTKCYWAVAWSPGLWEEQASMRGRREAPHIGQQSDSRGLKTPVRSFLISTVYFVCCLTHTLWSKIGMLCPYRHHRIMLTLSRSLYSHTSTRPSA